MKKSVKTSSTTEIELTFDGNKVSGVWYHPDLEPVICALCKKNSTCTQKCYRINPYCG